MTMNFDKLHKELAAQLPTFEGLADADMNAAEQPNIISTADYRAVFQSTPTPEMIALLTSIIEAHDPIDYLQDRINARRDASKTTVKAIPNWSTWTQAEWQTYFTANLSDSEADLVTSLGAARVMIKRQNTVINNLVKMLIAIRDQTWPDLPE